TKKKRLDMSVRDVSQRGSTLLNRRELLGPGGSLIFHNGWCRRPDFLVHAGSTMVHVQIVPARPFHQPALSGGGRKLYSPFPRFSSDEVVIIFPHGAASCQGFAQGVPTRAPGPTGQSTPPNRGRGFGR